MSSFDLGEIEGSSGFQFPPPVDEKIGRKILSALSFAGDDFPGEVHARVGLVWDRKGLPCCGSLLKGQGNSEDQLYIMVTYVADRWAYDKSWAGKSANDELNDIFLMAKEDQTLQHERKLEAERQAKLVEIEKLEAQIARLKDTL